MISLRRSKRDVGATTASAAASSAGSVSVSGSGFVTAVPTPGFFPAIAPIITSQ